ncbi:hypothetical protein [Lysobacter gummosus]|uniref:Uncharacterized protein n=1 Tax=Lysobacter gummosus TaxID=262324 RepID=A0ABY3XCX4_9GAMM|nr:hypothetical protein [Lysobacter gummosus]UNP28460.1 hypothetical protein MOV92_18450 [Lysobacter gummosus]
MESLTMLHTEIHFEGFLLSSGGSTPISLTISQPTVADDDAYCEIHAPGLIAKDTKIFGADAEQAR